MKNIFLLLLILFSSQFLIAQSDFNKAIKVEINLVRKYDSVIHKDFLRYEIEKEQNVINSDSVKVKYFDISIDVINTSSKPIYLWFMHCSWFDNFEINNDYMNFDGWGCDKNNPHVKEIKAGDKLNFKIALNQCIKFDYPSNGTIYGPQVEYTKLGLIVIGDIYQKESINVFDYDLYMNDKSKRIIIWSNPLKLLEYQSKPLEIRIPRNK